MSVHADPLDFLPRNVVMGRSQSSTPSSGFSYNSWLLEQRSCDSASTVGMDIRIGTNELSQLQALDSIMVQFRSRSPQLQHIGRLWSFRPLNDVEFDTVIFLQRLEPFTLQGGIVHENIFAVIQADKSKPFSIVEPLHRTLCLHKFLLFMAAHTYNGWPFRWAPEVDLLLSVGILRVYFKHLVDLPFRSIIKPR